MVQQAPREAATRAEAQAAATALPSDDDLDEDDDGDGEGEGESGAVPGSEEEEGDGEMDEEEEDEEEEEDDNEEGSGDEAGGREAERAFERRRQREAAAGTDEDNEDEVQSRRQGDSSPAPEEVRLRRLVAETMYQSCLRRGAELERLKTLTPVKYGQVCWWSETKFTRFLVCEIPFASAVTSGAFKNILMCHLDTTLIIKIKIKINASALLTRAQQRELVRLPNLTLDRLSLWHVHHC